MSKVSLKKTFKLLELIRRNTDKDHPITQAGLRELIDKQFGEGASSEIMGDKGTYARRLNELADAYNTDENGVLLPEDEWKIVFPGYGRDKTDGKKNGKVYYSQPVDPDELDFLIRSVRESHDFTAEEKASLEKRLTDALGNVHYQYEEFNGRVTRNLSSDEDEKTALIESNISKIKSYMKKGLMIDIDVRISNEENDQKTRICQVSPYRIVYKDSYYWLIANEHERPAETAPDNSYLRYERKFPWYTDILTAYRIDLIIGITEGKVPKTTTVHWTMTKDMRRGKYERDSDESPRKARKGAEVMKKLEEFDRVAKEITLKHNEDIFIAK